VVNFGAENAVKSKSGSQSINQWVYMVKTATGQNGDTKTATEMAIFKTATNSNNTCSSNKAYTVYNRP